MVKKFISSAINTFLQTRNGPKFNNQIGKMERKKHFSFKQINSLKHTTYYNKYMKPQLNEYFLYQPTQPESNTQIVVNYLQLVNGGGDGGGH